MSEALQRCGIGVNGLFVAFCCVFVLLSGTTALAYDSMVSMSVVDADVRDVLTGLASIGRVNMVLDDSVTGRISVDFKSIPFDTALDIVTRAKGLSIYRNGGIIIVASQEKMEKGFGQVQVFTLK